MEVQLPNTEYLFITRPKRPVFITFFIMFSITVFYDL